MLKKNQKYAFLWLGCHGFVNTKRIKLVGIFKERLVLINETFKKNCNLVHVKQATGVKQKRKKRKTYKKL